MYIIILLMKLFFFIKPKLVQCQFNHHHHVPEDSLDKHLKMCPYSALGMDADEIQVIWRDLMVKIIIFI